MVTKARPVEATAMLLKSKRARILARDNRPVEQFGYQDRAIQRRYFLRRDASAGKRYLPRGLLVCCI